MKCQGIFKFKTFSLREGGKFENAEGKEVEYPACYRIKVDSIEEGQINERNFKIATDSPLVAIFSKLEAYTDILIEFEVRLYDTRAVLDVVGVEVADYEE